MPLDLKVVVQQIGPRINPDGMEEHWQRRGWRGIGWFMEVPAAERGGFASLLAVRTVLMLHLCTSCLGGGCAPANGALRQSARTSP